MNLLRIVSLLAWGTSLCLSINIKNGSLVLLSTSDPAYKEAVCLDGSQPGYYIRTSTSQGASQRSWILHMGGGAWCNTPETCYNRSLTWLGSSKYWPPSAALNGFLSDNMSVNPHFHDWNIVYLMYCDGGSFAGYMEKPDVYNNMMIYYRGQKILDALLTDLQRKGLNQATDVILTGCSAGGLAVYLHADAVRMYFPTNVKYRAFADAGYFLDIPNINGTYFFRSGAQSLYKLQNTSMGVNKDCRNITNEMDGWICLFAPYSYRFIKSPLFVLNSEYDTSQLNGIYGLPCLPPHCTSDEMEKLQNFASEFREQVQPVLSSPLSNGYFLDSCLVHCQTLYDDTWSTYSIKGQTIEETFSAWYYGDMNKQTRLSDCVYPCNPSCPVKHNPLQEERSHIKILETTFTV